jgi:hypothetical protein
MINAWRRSPRRASAYVNSALRQSPHAATARGRELAALLCAGLTAALGCGDTVASLRASVGRHGSSAHADVVSTVNGSGIRAQEVQRLARAGGLSARAALARLQAERLLAQEAEQRGYGHSLETQRVARQALVQALLERDIEAERVDEAEISRAYTAARTRFEIPERRLASHVLALLPKAATKDQERAAHAFIEAACRELRASHDPAQTLEAFKAQSTSALPLKIEALPAFANDGAFVPEFSQAVFAMPRPGIVPAPVRTAFGWHAIVVWDIEPAKLVPMAVARAELQRELATQLHRRDIESLLTGLRKRTPIQYADAARQALDELEL